MNTLPNVYSPKWTLSIKHRNILMTTHLWYNIGSMALRTAHNETIFSVGDTVRVHYRIIEREKKAGKTKRSVEEKVKERIQPFEGVVVGIKGSQENKSFTVRRLADQKIGVERVFPLVSPWIEKVEVKQKGKVRRAKLNYLRGRGNLDVKKVLEEKKRAKKAKPAKRSPAKKAGKPRRTTRSKTSSK